jgi:internalin A
MPTPHDSPAGAPTRAPGWSFRSFLLLAGLILLAIVLAATLPSDYRSALRAVERAGGSTDAFSFSDGDSRPVRRVTLFGRAVTDAEVERVAPHLRHFPELFTLDLSMSRVTDQGLWHLRGLNHLGDLLLRYTRVSDDGVGMLEGWGNLRTLDLMKTRVSDRALEDVARNHPRLRSLNLDGTFITDRGLEHLEALPELEWLAVADTAVTDRGLASAGQLRNLRLLSLSGTRVRGEGLAHLTNLKRLRTLAVKRTPVCDESLARLQAALPALRVER